ncbi:MAG: ABC transporter substrate-binding protein [Saccharofermentanales bacterium]|jgi:branched-chain amino acid transport system substrate-binding protein|nr:ABC transporter substrate-binding protein [Clostridiaceae bacterium]
MRRKSYFAFAVALMLCLALLVGCAGQTTKPTDTAKPATPSGTDTAPSGDKQDETEPGTSVDVAPIKLGGIGPLTGGAAVYGVAVANGAKIAVDEINALGGMQFELNFQDDEHDAEKSVNAYNALKDWGMQILVGTVTTDPCIAVSAESYNDRVFTLTPSASSPAVIEGKDNVYQMCFSDLNQGIASAQYIQEKGLGTKIAIIYNNADAYSTGIYNKFISEAANNNLEVVSTTTFTNDTANDFSVQLMEAQKAGADLIFLPIYYEPSSLILAQANSMGYEPTFFGVDGMDGILTMENFNTELAEGVMLLTPFAADATDDLTVSFVAKYKDLYGEIPNQFAADGYDSVYAIYEALKDSNVTAETSASELCDLLIGIFSGNDFVFNGLTGDDMTWSKTGEVTKAPKGMIIENGVYVGMD